MIRKLAIKNFRCIRDVEVELAPLTAFVGPNASGKSAFLAALDPGIGLRENRRFHDVGVLVSVDIDGAERFVRAKGQNLEGTHSHSYQLLRLDLDQLRTEVPLQAQERLSPNGGNLTNVFETLERDQQIEVARRLCELVPVFKDLDTKPHGSGQKTFRFHDRWSETRYSPHEVSDGTMLLLAFLLVPFQQPQVDLLCIEEPERGLHPYLMGALVDQLRELTRGQPGRPPVQVVLATQSAEFLNHLEPEEVRFLRRDPQDGSVVVEAPDTATVDWKEAFDAYEEQLGQVWLAGGLGGVPG